jgi:hypothetical protein
MPLSIYAAENTTNLEVKPSPIHGDGVFAKIYFSSGDLIISSFGAGVIDLSGRHPSEAGPGNKIYVTPLLDRFGPSNQVQYNRHLPSNEFAYINHDSTNSNVKVLDNFKTYATQDIAIGEELTLNYNDIGYYN